MFRDDFVWGVASSAYRLKEETPMTVQRNDLG